MAAAHVCPCCGAALTRMRPQPDPHYGLPLVLCPGCGRAAVRRRDLLQQAWRQGVRANRALGVLCTQALVIVGLAAAALGWVTTLASLPPTWRTVQDERWLLLAAAATCLLTGIWLTAGLSHWRRWVAFVAWTMLLAILVALDGWLVSTAAPLLAVKGVTLLPGAPDVFRLLERLEIVALMIVVTALGIPAGMGILRLHATNRSLRFRRRRRRFRRLWRGA